MPCEITGLAVETEGFVVRGVVAAAQFDFTAEVLFRQLVRDDAGIDINRAADGVSAVQDCRRGFQNRNFIC